MTSFTPISDKEAQNLKNRLIPRGTILDFAVLPEITYSNGKSQVTEVVKSQSGNYRLNTVVELYNEEGNRITTIVDFTNMFSGKMAYKGRHFCQAIGIEKEYETGDLDRIASASIGKTGKCIIGVQKSDNEAYPDDRNIIEDYIPRDAGATSKQLKELDDDIPL